MAKKMNVSVTPLQDRVLVRSSVAEDKERKLDSGIILPGTVKGDKDQTKRGVVIALGEGKYDDGELRPIRGIKVGDTILFSWGDQLMIEDEEYYLVSESSILAVLK